MTEPGRENHAEQEAREVFVLSSEHAKRLLFWSFYLSQGNPGLQNLIFEWLHAAYPAYRIARDAQDEIVELTLPPTKRVVPAREDIFGPRSVRSLHTPLPFDPKPELEKQVAVLADKLEEQSSLQRSASELISELAAGMIERDYKFLVTDHRRPGRNSQGRPHTSPMADPYLSHVCYYGLAGNGNGIPEYDRMLSDIAGYISSAIRSGKLATEDLNKLTEIVQVYNRHHPQATVKIKEAGLD